MRETAWNDEDMVRVLRIKTGKDIAQTMHPKGMHYELLRYRGR